MSDAGGQPTSTFGLVDGIAFEVSGPADGDVVIFGHSLLFDRRMWAPQIEALSQTHRCVALDFPGHGESEVPGRHHAMLDNAEAYRLVMDHLGVATAVVVGLSMGGMAAIQFALAHPARVRGLVLVASSAEPEPGTSRAKNMAMAMTARVFGIHSWVMRQANDLMWSRRFQVEQPEVVATWEERVKALPRRALYRTIGAVMGRRAVGPRLAEVRCPTLVVVGDEDRMTPPVVSRKIADTIAGAELRILPRTGHIANLEEPEVVAKLIRAFLAQR